MSIPLVTSCANDKHIKKLILLMSTYTDGFGYERNKDGTTRPGWRDFERIVAEFLGGEAPEGKSIFDVTVQCPVSENKVCGISVKSKGFSKNKFSELEADGRVYMELTNSPAKLWDPLKLQGITEKHFEKMDKASEIGESILKTVHGWYLNSNVLDVDIESSVHLTVSYDKSAGDVEGLTFQLHTFELGFPEGIVWKYSSERCLSGYDPLYPDEILFDWYGLSGGQLKYYPKAKSAKFCSPQFKLLKAETETIEAKARRLWPDEFAKLTSTKENIVESY